MLLLVSLYVSTFQQELSMVSSPGFVWHRDIFFSVDDWQYRQESTETTCISVSHVSVNVYPKISFTNYA